MKTKKIVEVKCYNCESDKYNYYDSENGFRLVKCENCGLLYVNPRPTDEEISNSSISGMHKGDYILNQTDKYDESRIPSYIRILKELYGKETDRIMSWLDIGCGYGELMTALQKISESKMSIKGSEPNRIKRASAIKRGLNVDFINLDTHSDTYDVISLLNVYSHFPNPVEILSKIKMLLRRNGEILIQTGDSAHLAPKYHHKPYYLPDHLSFANQKILANVLTRVGFEIVKVKKYPYFMPKKIRLNPLMKDLLKFFLKCPNELANYSLFYRFFTKFQSRDMWIRAGLGY